MAAVSLLEVEKVSLEHEIAEMIIEVLNLEDMQANEINPDEALFGEGLGLDSIDALELSLAIAQRYGLQIKADDAENQKIFASLSSLSSFIEENRVTAS